MHYAGRGALGGPAPGEAARGGYVVGAVVVAVVVAVVGAVVGAVVTTVLPSLDASTRPLTSAFMS